jgi:hypothetical protein
MPDNPVQAIPFKRQLQHAFSLGDILYKHLDHLMVVFVQVIEQYGLSGCHMFFPFGNNKKRLIP